MLRSAIGKGLLVLPIIMLALTLVFPLMGPRVGGVLAATINVPADYSNIQAAVDSAQPGDTVRVAAGVYNETVTIDKSLVLLGARAGVDARGRTGPEAVIAPTGAVAIDATNASATLTMDGFAIRGGRGMVTTKATTVRFVNNIVSATVAADGADGLVVIHGGARDVTVKYNDISPTAVGDGTATNALRITADTNGPPSVVVDSNWLHNASAAGLALLQINLGKAVVSVTNNDIYNNAGDGILAESCSFSSLTTTGNVIRDNGQTGVKIWSGITGDGVPVRINQNDIYNNAQEGVYNYNANPFTVDATYNWWGAADGPGPVGPGSGDGVSLKVDYSPWLTAPIGVGAAVRPMPPFPDVYTGIGAALSAGMMAWLLRRKTVSQH